MNENEKFRRERLSRIEEYPKNDALITSANEFFLHSLNAKYSYNFEWMGRPIVQYPQDILAMQEIMWAVKPDLVIETGIAHGGSLVLYASFMEMMGIADGHVLGIDVDIRLHNRDALLSHPMKKRITMIEGSSISPATIEQVVSFSLDFSRILVVLDSNHTHEHVLSELRHYSPLVCEGSYCVVFDTIIEYMPEGSFPDREWDKSNNPQTAVWQFLQETNSFVIDETIQNKLVFTAARNGYLKRIKSH